MSHASFTDAIGCPMQSWGSRSRFTRRETEAWPTKSGVIGIVAAALGVGRDESLERFDGLRFGVRVDQPGTIMSDYQTARTDEGTCFRYRADTTCRMRCSSPG